MYGNDYLEGIKPTMHIVYFLLLPAEQQDLREAAGKICRQDDDDGVLGNDNIVIISNYLRIQARVIRVLRCLRISKSTPYISASEVGGHPGT